MEIRRFQPGDEAGLFRVYFTAIHQIASRDYSREQIDAWAPADLDKAQWAARIQQIQPFVALLHNQIVGYADIQPDGYIDHFFVSGDHPRQGIGTQLMVRLLEEARSLGLKTLTSNVSKTAEPFFAFHGFEVVKRNHPILRGVTLQNAQMHKDLNQSQPSPRGRASGG